MNALQGFDSAGLPAETKKEKNMANIYGARKHR